MSEKFYQRIYSPKGLLNDMHSNAEVLKGEFEKEYIEEYYKYLEEKLDFYLSKREGGLYFQEDIEYMKNNLRMYVEMKYMTPNKRTPLLSNTILDSWRKTYKPELIATILEDAITNPNETVKKYFFEAREDLVKILNQSIGHSQRFNFNQKVRVAQRDQGDVGVYSLIETPLFNENEIIESTIFYNTLNSYGFSKEEADRIYNRYARYIFEVKKRQPNRINEMLTICENFELFAELAKGDELITQDAINANIRGGIGNNKKNLLLTNPRALVTRRNFLNWVEYNNGEGGLFEGNKTIYSSVVGYLDMLMRKETGEHSFFSLYEKEINAFINNTYYPESNALLRDSKIQFTYSEMLDAFRDTDEFKYFTEGIRKGQERTKAEEDWMVDRFTRIALNTAFGEPTKEEKELMERCYDYTLEKARVQARQKEGNNPESLNRKKESGASLVGHTEKGPYSPREGGNREYTRRKGLDEEWVKKYVGDVEKLGIECEGVITTDGGVSVSSQHGAKIFVFKVGEYRICESVGQAGNGSYIVKSDAPWEEFVQELDNRGTNLREIAKNGEALAVYHKGGVKEEKAVDGRKDTSRKKRNKEYNFNPNRIILLAELISSCAPDSKDLSEFRQKLYENISSKEGFTLDELRKMIIAELDASKVPDAAEYIKQVGIWEEALKKYNMLLQASIANRMEETIQDEGEKAGITTPQMEKKKIQIADLKKISINKGKEEK